MAKKDDAYAICTAQKKKSGMGHDAWKRCIAKLKKSTTEASINELWEVHHHTELSPRARALVHAKRTEDEAAIKRHSEVLADEDEYKDDPHKMLKSIHHHTTLEKDDPRYREFDKWGSHEHDRGRKNFTGGATGGAVWRDPKDQALFTRDEFPGKGSRSDDKPEEGEEERKDETSQSRGWYGHRELSSHARALVHAKRTGDEEAEKKHSKGLSTHHSYTRNPDAMLKSIHHHAEMEDDDPAFVEFNDNGSYRQPNESDGKVYWNGGFKDEPPEDAPEKKDEDRIMTFNKRLVSVLEKKALKTEKMKNVLPDGPKAAPQATKSNNAAEADLDDEDTIFDDCGTKLVSRYRAKKQKNESDTSTKDQMAKDKKDAGFGALEPGEEAAIDAGVEAARKKEAARRKAAGLPPHPDIPEQKEELELGKRGMPAGWEKEADKEAYRKKYGKDLPDKPDDSKEDEKDSLTASKKSKVKEAKKKDDKWIQKAVDPDHEGDCTPMTKKTCTPKRKALAKTFKKMGRKKDKAITAKDEK
jgi:hypothetical protein